MTDDEDYPVPECLLLEYDLMEDEENEEWEPEYFIADDFDLDDW